MLRLSYRTPLVLLAAAIVALAVGGAAQAKSYTIVPGKYGVKRIGSFHNVYSAHNQPTIGKAVRAFGTPSSRFQKQGGCVVKWQRLGLRIEFYNFGGLPPGQTICGDDASFAQSFNVTAHRKLRTWRGLRLGNTEDRLLRLHPGARWHDRDQYTPAAWWLRRQTSPFGDGGQYAIVAARVRHGRVVRFDGWIGSAGE
jgi:hypothetical protein